MKYENPIIEVIELYMVDLVRTSQPLPTTPGGDGPDWDI